MFRSRMKEEIIDWKLGFIRICANINTVTVSEVPHNHTVKGVFYIFSSFE